MTKIVRYGGFVWMKDWFHWIFLYLTKLKLSQFLGIMFRILNKNWPNLILCLLFLFLHFLWSLFFVLYIENTRNLKEPFFITRILFIKIKNFIQLNWMNLNLIRCPVINRASQIIRFHLFSWINFLITSLLKYEEPPKSTPVKVGCFY